MNIRSIKNRADELLIYAKPQFVRILTIMMFIGLIPSLFSSDNMGMINMILSILFLTFSHGYIVSSLKIVRNNQAALKDEDAWVGFSRFKDLFTTYLLSDLVALGVVIVVTLILSLFVAALSGSTIVAFVNVASNGDAASIARFLMNSGTLIFMFLMIFIVYMVVMYILSLYLFATPYLLEQYRMKNGKAIKESFQFIKGHVVDLFKLEISYIGWMILVALIGGIVSGLLSSVPIIGTLIGAIAGGLVAIYTFYPQYYLSKAIFFEEIAYRRYAVQMQQDDLSETETMSESAQGE